MKLFKRFLAAALSALLLCPMTAYADQAEEARALFREIEAQQKAFTDMNAVYDMDMSISGSALESQGVPSMNIRMEMDIKMNNLQDPENLRYMAVNKVSQGDSALSETTMYYQNGYCYMDMAGQKLRVPMAVNDILKQTEASASAFNVSEDLIKDFSLRTEGQNRIVSYTMDDSRLQEYLQQVLGSANLAGVMAGSSESVSIHNVSGQYVVNPNGLCENMRISMDMDMTVEGETLSISIDGDVHFVDLGQPVEITFPDLSEYVDVAAAAQNQ